MTNKISFGIKAILQVLSNMLWNVSDYIYGKYSEMFFDTKSYLVFKRFPSLIEHPVGTVQGNFSTAFLHTE